MSDKADRRDFALGRVGWFLFGAVASVLLTWKFADKLSNSVDLLGVIAAIFSILAAALIAIISILGDPSMLIDHTWRRSALTARETQRKLHRKTDIFVLYVVTLGLLLAFAITDKESHIYWYMQRVVFFASTFSFWASLTLPHSLKEIQKKRLDDAIDAKRGTG